MADKPSQRIRLDTLIYGLFSCSSLSDQLEKSIMREPQEEPDRRLLWFSKNTYIKKTGSMANICSMSDNIPPRTVGNFLKTLHASRVSIVELTFSDAAELAKNGSSLFEVLEEGHYCESIERPSWN